MNDDQENEQLQSDLENNQIAQAEQKVANKARNLVKDMGNKSKQFAMDAFKKAIKVAFKAVKNFIIATAPVSIIVIIAIIIGILIISLFLSVYGGITGIFKRDIKSGDVSTIDQNVSIYDERVDSIFTAEASSDVAKNALQIKEYIQPLYHYHQGNNMKNYPLTLGETDNSGYGIDCSTYVTWVLIMSGYSQFKDRAQLTTADFWGWINGSGGYNFSSLGWTYHKVTEEGLTVAPGDLLLKTSSSRHIEIYAGNGTLGAGSDRQIKNINLKSYLNKSIKEIISGRKL